MESIKKARLHLLDELRGFAIVCMVFYHAFYSMMSIFSIDIGKALFDFFTPAEPFFAALFIFISGLASRLTRSNALRGAKLLGIATALMLIMWLLTFVGINEPIWFGILHLLSVSMLIFAAIRPLLDKVNPTVGIIVCAIIFALTYNIDKGYLGFGGLRFDIPPSIRQLPFLFPIGIFNSNFYSSDYFPIFPWLFVFLAGSFIGIYAANGKFPKCFYNMHFKPLAFIGRHSLIIYLAHQPVIFAVMMLMEQIVK